MFLSVYESLGKTNFFLLFLLDFLAATELFEGGFLAFEQLSYYSLITYGWVFLYSFIS